jgi:hypothetical protein
MTRDLSSGGDGIDDRALGAVPPKHLLWKAEGRDRRRLWSWKSISQMRQNEQTKSSQYPRKGDLMTREKIRHFMTLFPRNATPFSPLAVAPRDAQSSETA